MRVVNDRRVKPRAALRGDAVVYSARDELRCHCLDVSAGGMALLGPRPARIRERVIVQAQFGSVPVRGEAIVVRGRRTAHGHLWGLRFLRLDDQTRANLERYVQQTLAHAARVRQAQLFASRAWGNSAAAHVPPPTHAPPIEPAAPAAPVSPPQPPASYEPDADASAFATLPGGVQTPGYASLQEAELAERQAQSSSPSAGAPVFDPQIQDGDAILGEEGGVYEPSSVVADDAPDGGDEDDVESDVSMLEAQTRVSIEQAVELAETDSDAESEEILQIDDVEIVEDDASSMALTRAQGRFARSDFGRSDSQRFESERRPGLGPVCPPSFDEDAQTHQVARPSAAASFDEWERDAALPSSSPDEPQLDAVEDAEIERSEGSFASFEPNLYDDSGAALPFPGDEEPQKPKAASPAGRIRAPMLLDGEEGVPDVDAPVFGDIVEATERPAASSRRRGVDETDVRRGHDLEQYTPVGTLPPVQVTEPTPVGSLEERTRKREQPTVSASAFDETGPVSVGPAHRSMDEPDDDAGTDPHYAVLPEFDYPDPDLPRTSDDSGSGPSPAQTGFTVVATMEDLGLRPPRVIGSAAPSHADVGDYSVLPEYEPEGGTLSGFTMVASPRSWDVPEPGGTMIVPGSGPAVAAPPAAGLPSFPRPDDLPQPVPNLYGNAASLPGGSLRFEEQLTGMRPPTSPSVPASAEQPAARAPAPAVTRSASRALVEEALAQLRVKSEAKRKRTGPNEVVQAGAAKERTRRRKRHVEHTNVGDPQLKDLFQAAVAEIDKESPR